MIASLIFWIIVCFLGFIFIRSIKYLFDKELIKKTIKEHQINDDKLKLNEMIFRIVIDIMSMYLIVLITILIMGILLTER